MSVMSGFYKDEYQRKRRADRWSVLLLCNYSQETLYSPEWEIKSFSPSKSTVSNVLG